MFFQFGLVGYRSFHNIPVILVGDNGEFLGQVCGDGAGLCYRCFRCTTNGGFSISASSFKLGQLGIETTFWFETWLDTSVRALLVQLER